MLMTGIKDAIAVRRKYYKKYQWTMVGETACSSLCLRDEFRTLTNRLAQVSISHRICAHLEAMEKTLRACSAYSGCCREHSAYWHALDCKRPCLLCRLSLVGMKLVVSGARDVQGRMPPTHIKTKIEI
eukprot:6192756-Pleurochrysis_carterae.AAC.6